LFRAAFPSEPPALWSTDVTVGKEFLAAGGKYKKKRPEPTRGVSERSARPTRYANPTGPRDVTAEPYRSIRTTQWPTRYANAIVRNARQCIGTGARATMWLSRSAETPKLARPIMCSQAAGSIIMSWVTAPFVHIAVVGLGAMRSICRGGRPRAPFLLIIKYLILPGPYPSQFPALHFYARRPIHRLHSFLFIHYHFDRFVAQSIRTTPAAGGEYVRTAAASAQRPRVDTKSPTH
jgi:hypothetical protein